MARRQFLQNLLDFVDELAVTVVLSSHLLTSGRKVLAADVQDCLKLAGQGQAKPGEPDGFEACLIRRDLHLAATYQPADRYWPFQWIELTGALVLSALLSGLAFWRLRR
ncbi:hypothetical protein [Cryptosporangium sp. NPDC051539]|uniref:hypothetical protein n=1 Tax=Cryptosporangium sp. NPDC051539 TaxID=3363962 RepID=UPI0037B6D828